MDTYTILSPWAEVDDSDATGLCPRLDTLAGKRIGLFSHFKEHAVRLLKAVGDCITERYPDTTVSLLQYKKDTSEAENDPEFAPVLKKWLEGLDAVVCAFGDMGSCALFVGYNAAWIEKLGKPVVILSDKEFITSARSGVTARGVPAIRIVETAMHDLSFEPTLDGRVTTEIIEPAARGALDGIILGLTAPLTAEEQRIVHRSNTRAHEIFTGTAEEVNRHLYRRGYTNGTPAVPPTEEAIRVMLQGTDLPRDHVLGYLPPMRGKATVEKIAINAVMAGCLPTHMPVLIAAVEAMLDPALHLEGYTCSRSNWAPLVILNGPIRGELDINTGANLFSPYRLASSAISRAVGYIILNISGVRPQQEDLSGMGHSARFGICIGENEEDSPWEPLSVRYGLQPGESAVTLFWPSEHTNFRSRDTDGILTQMCQIKDFGFRPGCCFVMCPEQANTLSRAGYSKEDVLDFIFEYSRRPASSVPIRWLRDNNHLPEGVKLPVDGNQSARSYWTKEHLLILVAGEGYGSGLTGGGDHGGPICRKLTLPESWASLVEQYRISPDYGSVE